MLILQMLMHSLIINGILSDVLDDTFMEKMYTQIYATYNYVFQKEQINPIDQDVSFNLYTRKNPQIPQIIPPKYPSLLTLSYFNPKLKTYVVIHGYTDHKNREIIANLRQVLIRAEDANVIVVDWGRLASFIYFNAVTHTIPVGRYVGQFLLNMQFFIDFKKLHLIGHSLGAHISGIAGSVVGGTIARITGLDPAGPLFDYIEERGVDESLDKSDAIFVDVIHTNTEEFGITKAIGHVDFYPNGGSSPQPGCRANLLTVVSCSHIRALDFYIESITSATPFQARQCNVTQENLTCLREKPVHMGHYVSLKARGVYFLETNAEPPFAKAAAPV